jgi:hypothetical protein
MKGRYTNSRFAPLGGPGHFPCGYTDHRQVFGLVGALALEGYLPTRRRFPAHGRASAYDDFRSYLPLRGSPRFSPGSLFPRSLKSKRTDSCKSVYSMLN